MSAPPVSAHETSLSVGANTATLSSGHNHVTVCDNENDGNRVYAEFVGHPLGGPSERHYDSYGGGCSTSSLDFPAWTTWRLCEVHGACVFTFV